MTKETKINHKETPSGQQGIQKNHKETQNNQEMQNDHKEVQNHNKEKQNDSKDMQDNQKETKTKAKQIQRNTKKCKMCVSFNIGILLMCMRGEGPFMGQCTGTHQFMISKIICFRLFRKYLLF